MFLHLLTLIIKIQVTVSNNKATQYRGITLICTPDISNNKATQYSSITLICTPDSSNNKATQYSSITLICMPDSSTYGESTAKTRYSAVHNFQCMN
jgi:hypothetical protein